MFITDGQCHAQGTALNFPVLFDQQSAQMYKCGCIPKKNKFEKPRNLKIVAHIMSD